MPLPLCVPDHTADANRKRLTPELFSALLTTMHRKPDADKEHELEVLR